MNLFPCSSHASASVVVCGLYAMRITVPALLVLVRPLRLSEREAGGEEEEARGSSSRPCIGLVAEAAAPATVQARRRRRRQPSSHDTRHRRQATTMANPCVEQRRRPVPFACLLRVPTVRAGGGVPEQLRVCCVVCACSTCPLDPTARCDGRAALWLLACLTATGMLRCVGETRRRMRERPAPPRGRTPPPRSLVAHLTVASLGLCSGWIVGRRRAEASERRTTGGAERAERLKQPASQTERGPRSDASLACCSGQAQSLDTSASAWLQLRPRCQSRWLHGSGGAGSGSGRGPSLLRLAPLPLPLSLTRLRLTPCSCSVCSRPANLSFPLHSPSLSLLRSPRSRSAMSAAAAALVASLKSDFSSPAFLSYACWTVPVILATGMLSGRLAG